MARANQPKTGDDDRKKQRFISDQEANRYIHQPMLVR